MLIFFDESFRKSRSPHKRAFGVLAGIAIPEKDLHRVSNDVFLLKLKHFGHEFASNREIKGKELLKNRVFRHLADGNKTASLDLAEDLLQYIRTSLLKNSTSLAVCVSSKRFTSLSAMTLGQWILPFGIFLREWICS